MNDNTRIGLDIFPCLNANPLIILSPKTPEILDIYLVVILVGKI